MTKITLTTKKKHYKKITKKTLAKKLTKNNLHQ